MLRRHARLRREYLYRKSKEQEHKKEEKQIEIIQKHVTKQQPFPTHLRDDAMHLHKKAAWKDDGPQLAAQIGDSGGGAVADSQDDEYRFAGVEDPVIMVTTTRDPHSRLINFAKEMKLIFPTAQKINRGTHNIKELVEVCRANNVSDLVIFAASSRGEPNCMIVCHLPHGPTAFFTIYDIVMRNEIPDIKKMSEQYPHLIFHNFKTQLGKRCMNILKYLFPVPKEDSKRVMTFANHNDYICFRHHTYKQVEREILTNRPVSMVLDMEEIRTAWQDSDFITDCLCWHNVYRQRHNCPPLTMCSDLCHSAQTWANHLAHTNRFYYRNDRDVGQNLFCRPDNGFQNDVTGQEVASYWYSAVKQYDFVKEPDILHANVNAGHFTQLVWCSSRLFGVGKARSRSGKIVVVAHYSPAGNVPGAFHANVPRPLLENVPEHAARLLRAALQHHMALPPPRGMASSSTDESEHSGGSGNVGA